MSEPGNPLNNIDEQMNPRSRTQRVFAGFAIGIGALVVVVALLLGAFTVVMARMPEYRAQMQAWLSEHAKMDIQFAELRAGWRGYGPELVFTNAVVRSADRQRVLAIAERGGVGLDLWQGLRTGRLVAARFYLQGTELKLQRRSDGTFEIVGQADWPEFETDSTFKLDSLPVGELTVRKARVSFRDLKTGRGPWVVDNVALDISRTTRVFDLDGQATLPNSLGKALTFNVHGEGSLNDVRQLKWQAQVAGTQLDLMGWTQVMPEDWIAPTQGQGSFQLKAEFLGEQPQRFSGRLDFVDVVMKLPKWSLPLPQADPLQVSKDDPDAQPLNVIVDANTTSTDTSTAAVSADAALRYSNIAVGFTTVVDQQSWRTRFERLQLARDGSAWPSSTADVSMQLDATDSGLHITQLQASAQTIVLDNLWPLLVYLPENPSNAKLRALNASGRLSNLAVRYQRDPNSEPRYALRAEFTQLGASPVASMPGISGLSGVVTATGARGQLHLDSHDLTFSVPRTFRTPLPIDQVTGTIAWTRTTQGTQLHSTDLAVTNADGQAKAQFTLDIPREGAAVIDMQAQGSNLNAAAAPRYMPAGIMHKRTLAWLDAAFPTGTVKQAVATLKGPLNKFPFRGEEGLFLIKAQIDGLTLNYQPGWMPATDLRVEAEFRNAGLSATATAGRVNSLNLDHAEGRVKDYRDSEIYIKAQTHGGLDKALQFVQQSPVGPAIGNLFQQLSGQGELQGNANMYFPLKDFNKRKVDINVVLQNATVSLAGIAQSADQLNGSLRIYNDAITGADLNGRFLQGNFTVAAQPATIAATSTVRGGRYDVVATGQVQAQPLTQFLKLPAWLKVDGGTAYRFSMPGYPQHDADGARHLYSVDSDLRGLSINLPAPVDKAANSARTLHIDADLRNDDMQLRGALGDLRGLARLQQANNAWRFDRAGLRADAIAAALPSHTGLRVEGRIPEFALDEWLKLGNSNTDAAVTNSNTTRVQDILRAANVNIDRLHVYGFDLQDVRGLLQAADTGWRVDVAGEQASGQVLVPYEFAGGRPLTLDMDTLKLATATAAGNQNAKRPAPILDPRDLPSLRADIKHFQYGDHNFGALQLNGVRTAQGLQVNTLNISGDSFSGVGNGSWLQVGNAQQGALALTLESNDLRATMQQFNYADFIAAKNGKLIANLRWPGGLDEDILGRASGSLELQVNEGQLLNVQPGAGRVLGLLSVAALPRRLGLDFRDITDKGLAFDNIHADFVVQNGEARTQNLLLRGATAEIGIAGRMGLGAHDYDQTAVVTGDVGNALPLAGVAAGGPVVGAALLLFTQIFKEPLKGVARAYYHIGGSWDDPQVERIDSEVGKASLSGAESNTTPAASDTPVSSKP